MSRILTILVLACLLPVAVGASPTDLIDFNVEDQFKKLHTRSEVNGKVFIIVGSDRGGSGFNGAWSNAIAEGVGELGVSEQVVSVGLADLRGLPFFLKGMIRGKFSRKPEEWSIMDWKGVFPKAYEFEKDVSNILVFGPAGRLLHRTSGQEVDSEEIGAILEKIETALQ